MHLGFNKVRFNSKNKNLQKTLLFLAFIFLGTTLVSESKASEFANYDQAYSEFLERTRQMSRELEKINSSSKNCDIVSLPLQCNSASICSHLESDGLYTYTDSEGRKAINASMYSAVYNYSFCGDGGVGQLDDNPFLLPDKFADERVAGSVQKLKENQNKLKKEFARLENIFTDAVSQVVKVLESRKTSENKNYIDSLIRRVKSIELNKYSADDIYNGSLMSTCEIPNAYYSPPTHQVTICPQYLSSPEGNLFFILAHEISHSIDACNANFDLGKSGINLPTELGNPRNSSVVDKGVNKENNPFTSAFRCLASPNVIAVQNSSKSDVLKQYEKTIAENPDSASRITPGYYWTKKNFEKAEYCGFFGKGHTQEASADWFATEALAMKLKALPDSARKKEFAFGAAALTSDLCDAAVTKSLAVADKVKGSFACQSLTKNMQVIKEGAALGDKSHPTTKDRINKIILANPEVQKSLNCQGSAAASYCQ